MTRTCAIYAVLAMACATGQSRTEHRPPPGLTLDVVEVMPLAHTASISLALSNRSARPITYDGSKGLPRIAVQRWQVFRWVWVLTFFRDCGTGLGPVVVPAGGVEDRQDRVQTWSFRSLQISYSKRR
jgi:hypothetical protein